MTPRPSLYDKQLTSYSQKQFVQFEEGAIKGKPIKVKDTNPNPNPSSKHDCNRDFACFTPIQLHLPNMAALFGYITCKT